MWRNTMEIADIVETLTRHEDKRVRAYALVLARWVNIVNENSDGWAYWRAGAKAGEKLSDLLARVANHWSARLDFDQPPYIPTDAELRATLTPMKTLATKRGLPSPIAVLEELAR